jgi:tetratricopeptide (TPR) repeat protein
MALRHLRILLVMIGTMIIAGCGSGEQTGDDMSQSMETAGFVEDIHRQISKERKEMDTPAERAAITKKFLTDYPSSRFTADEIDIVYWYQGTELADKAGALSFVANVRQKINDPAVAEAVDKLLIGYYGEADKVAKMTEVAQRLEAAGALDFDSHWKVITGAITASDWRLARSYCAKARPMATGDVLRTEYPDRQFSEAEITEAVDERVGMMLVGDGWARANLGEVDEALADFVEADKRIPRYYFDIPEYDLYVYWGNTLMMKGDFEAAIDRFAFNGLVMQNDAAMAGLKRAYAGQHGSEEGFNAYAKQLHRKIARTIHDFEMPNYAGDRFRFADIQEKVTLLSLWFPT